MPEERKFTWKRYSELEAREITHPDESSPYGDSVKTWTYTLMLVADGLDARELAMTMCTLKPGEAVAHHGHPDQEEIYILMKGNSEVRTDEEKVDAEAYSFFRFPPGCNHSVYNNSDEDAEWLFVFAKPKSD